MDFLQEVHQSFERGHFLTECKKSTPSPWKYQKTADPHLNALHVAEG